MRDIFGPSRGPKIYFGMLKKPAVMLASGGKFHAKSLACKY